MKRATEHPTYPFISCDRETAAQATGVSVTRIAEAARLGDLVAHYSGTKPLFRAADLDEWIESLPTEKPQR